MKYTFDTQYFALTDESIFFLRNRFAYREVKDAQIEKIELVKGTDVKRPVVSYIVGLILLVLSIIILIDILHFDIEYIKSLRRYMGSVLVLFFVLFSMGAYSFYRALPIHPVIKFTMVSGETESLSLTEVIKEKKMRTLTSCLSAIVQNDKITTDKVFIDLTNS